MSRLNYDLMPGLSDLYSDQDSEFAYMWRDERENLECKINKAMVNTHFAGLFDREHDCWSEPVHSVNHSIPYLNDYNKPSFSQKLTGGDWNNDPNWGHLRPPDIGCFRQMLYYAAAWIEYNIINKPGANEPVAPDGWCLFEGGFIFLVVIAVIGILAVYAGPLLTSLGGLFGTLAQFLEFIWSSFEGLFTTVIDFVTFGFQYVLDGWRLMWDGLKYIRDLIVGLTGANIYLVTVTELTAVVWLISQLLLEIFEVELEWETTDFYKIFECLDTPINLILDFIESLTGSRNILYWMCKIFVIPFEIAILAISLLIGVVWFLFKELVDVIKNS